MSNFLPPKYRATDSVGAPLVGALLYFYETGTTTPLATYSDESLSTPNANPMVSASDGYFGACFMQNQAYTVVLKTASGTTLWAMDNVRSVYLANATIVTRLGQLGCTPLDYGAVGDGVADETTAVQAAITAASCVVDLMGKTYRCDSTINLKSNMVLKNGTIDCSRNTGVGISAVGVLSGSTTALTSDCSWASSLVVGSSAGFAADDLALIRNSAASRCQTARVKEVSDGTHLKLERACFMKFVATTTTVQKIASKSNIVLDNVRIVGSSSSDATGLFLYGVYDFRMVDCVVDGSYHSIGVVSSMKLRFTNVSFDNYTEMGAYLANGVIDITFKDCEYNGLLSGGVSTGIGINMGGDPTGTYTDKGESLIVIEGCNFGPQAQGVCSHITFEGSAVLGDVRVIGCRFDKMTGGADAGGMYINVLTDVTGPKGFLLVQGCDFRVGTATRVVDIMVSGTAIMQNCHIPDSGGVVEVGASASVSTSVLGCVNLLGNVFVGSGLASGCGVSATGEDVIAIGNICTTLSLTGSENTVDQHNIVAPP